MCFKDREACSQAGCPVVKGQGGGFGGQELEFILRNLVELKTQVEDSGGGGTTTRLSGGQVIDLGDHSTVDVLPENDKDGDAAVVHRTGTTMAEETRKPPSRRPSGSTGGTAGVVLKF